MTKKKKAKPGDRAAKNSGSHLPQGKKALLVTGARSTKGDSLLSEHLHKALKFDVTLTTAQHVEPSQLTDSDLVVTTSPSCPSCLRNAAKPVVACDAAILYDLGLTRAVEGTDFGMDANGHPLTIQADHKIAAGLTGPIQILGQELEIGWGRPSPAASSIIVINGSVSPRPVVFCHERSSSMSGLAAPENRIAFLVGARNLQHLTETGWSIFDQCVEWALSAPSDDPPADDPTATTNSSDTKSEQVRGERKQAKRATHDERTEKEEEFGPTQDMTRKEYREWVRDRIASKLFYRIASVFSVVGLAGIFAIGAIATNYFDNQLTLKVEELKDEVMDDISTPVKSEVASTLLNVTGISDNIKKEANKAIETVVTEDNIEKKVQSEVKKVVDRETDPQQIGNQVRDAIELQRDFIVSEASKGIAESGGIQTVLLDQLQPTVRDESADVNQRASALHMVLIFESDEVRLRSLLAEVLASEEVFGSEFYEVALKSYRPAGQGAESESDAPVLAAVMDHAVAAPELTPATRDALVLFASRFSAQHANLISGRISNPDVNSLNTRLLLDCLVQLQGDEVVNELVAMAADDGERDLSDVGWLGLSELRRDRALAFETRKAAVKRLWPLFEEAVLNEDADSELPADLPRDFRSLLRALRAEVLHPSAYDYLEDGLETASTDELLSRLDEVESNEHITSRGYARLRAALTGGVLTSGGAISMLRSLRDEMSVVAYSRLRDRLEMGAPSEIIEEELEDLYREGEMSRRAHDELRGRFAASERDLDDLLFSLREDMSSEAFDRLRRVARSPSEAMRELTRLEDEGQMSSRAFRTLQAALANTGGDVLSLLLSLRDREMSRDAYERLRIVVNRGSSADALSEVKRLYDDGEMSSQARLELTEAIQARPVDSERVETLELKIAGLEERIRTLGTVSAPESSVNNALKRLAFLQLMRPGSDDWNKVVRASLWPEAPETADGRQVIDRIVTAWVERLKMAQADGEKLDAAYDSLWNAILDQPKCMERQPLQDALVFVLQHCPESSLDPFVERFFVDCVDDRESDRGLVRILTAALRRDYVDNGVPQLKNAALQQTRSRRDQDPGLTVLFLQSLSGATTGSNQAFAKGSLQEVDQSLDESVVDESKAALIKYALQLLETLLLADTDPRQQQQLNDSLEDSSLVQRLEKIASANIDQELTSLCGELDHQIRQRLSWLGNLAGRTDLITINREQEIADWPEGEKWVALSDASSREFTLVGVSGNVEVSVVDEPGMRVLRRFRLGNGVRKEITETEAGYLRLRKSGTLETKLKMLVRDRPEPLPLSESLDAATDVQVDVVYRGEFRNPEGGWAKFRGNAGTTYLIQTSNLTTGTDTQIDLTDKDGNILSSNDDFYFSALDSTGSRVEWICAKTSVFGVRVASYGGTTTGRFDFQVLAGPGISVSASVNGSKTAETAATLAVSDDAIPVMIPERASIGWVRLMLEGNQIYRLRSDSNVEVYETTDKAVTLLESAGDDEEKPSSQGEFWRDKYFVTTKSSAYWFKAYRPDPGSRVVIAVDLHAPISGFAAIQSADAPLEAPRIELQKDSGYLCNVSSEESYVSFRAEMGKKYEFSAIPLTGSGRVAISIVRLNQGGEPELLARDSGGTQWECKETGQYYLKLTSATDSVILLNPVKYKVLSRNFPSLGIAPPPVELPELNVR